MTLDPQTPDHGTEFDCALMKAGQKVKQLKNLLCECTTHKEFTII